MDKIVVIIPTYNEAQNIGKMIDALFGEIFPSIKGAKMCLLVVDDTSPDGTGAIVEKNMKKYKELYLLSGKKEGLGMAYVRGMKYAMDTLHADAVVEMDADFQHNPKYLPGLVNAYLEGADYAIGSRYCEGGAIPKTWAWHRRAVSYYGNLFARLVLWLPKLHDVTTGFRITRVKGVLEKIKLDKLMELRRFAFKVDLFYQSVKLSKKTTEVPIVFGTREREASKFSLSEMISTYKVVVTLRFRAWERFIKFGVVGFIGFVINALGLEIMRALPLSQVLADYFVTLGVSQTVSTASAWAAALAAEIAIASNFILNNAWTFSDTQLNGAFLIFKKFLQFNLTSLGAIVIQFVVVGATTEFFGDTGLVRLISLFFAVVFLVIPYNYTMYNLFIWKRWKIPFLEK